MNRRSILRRVRLVREHPPCMVLHKRLAEDENKVIFSVYAEPQVPPLRYAPVGMTNLYRQWAVAQRKVPSAWRL